MEYYSALKRKEILTQVITGMNLEDITLSKKKPVTKVMYYSPLVHLYNLEMTKFKMEIDY